MVQMVAMADHKVTSTWLTTTLLALIAIGALTTGAWAGKQLYDHRPQPTARIEADAAQYVADNLDHVATILDQETTKGFGKTQVNCPHTIDQAAGRTFKCAVEWPDAESKAIRDEGSVSVDVWMQTTGDAYWLQID